MEESFVSFENLNQSSAWIPRVFSHLRKKSESLPTDIDSTGLHILTSFAPWTSAADTNSDASGLHVRNLFGRANSVYTRRKSNSADSTMLDKSTSLQNDFLAVQSLKRSDSHRSVHVRSASLPLNLGNYLPNFFNQSMSPQSQEIQNESTKPIVQLTDSHSVCFEGSGLSMYTVYLIEFEVIKQSQSDHVSKFKIRKRFSEFKDLYDNMIKIYGIRLPPFPQKSVIGRFSSMMIQSRLMKFLALLEFILSNPVLKDSKLFLHFLGLDYENSWEDLNSECSTDSFRTAMQL